MGRSVCCCWLGCIFILVVLILVRRGRELAEGGGHARVVYARWFVRRHGVGGIGIGLGIRHGGRAGGGWRWDRKRGEVVLICLFVVVLFLLFALMDLDRRLLLLCEGVDVFGLVGIWAWGRVRMAVRGGVAVEMGGAVGVLEGEGAVYGGFVGV